MTTLLLIRHGETDWNRESVFRGQTDVALNGKGLKQASLLARYLRNAPLAAVYSSPLKRASETAEMVANYHGIQVEKAAQLTDMNYGVWQGLPQHTAMEKYRELYDQWLRNPHLVKIPQGETLQDVRERAYGLTLEVTENYGGAVAMVSHRVVNKVLICALLGLDDSHFWNVQLDTCGITMFDYRNGMFVLTKHNDTSFLKRVSSEKEDDF
jgi:broad specificity phosphatase PhoE